MSRFLEIIKMSIKQLQKPYYQGFAAQISFYFIMSIVPILVLTSQVLSTLFRDNWKYMVEWIMKFIEESPLVDNIKDMLLREASYGSSIIFILVALWSASKAQFALIGLANYTMSGGQSTGRGFLVERLKAIITLAILILLIVFAMVVLAYGDTIVKLVLKIIGQEAIFDSLWVGLRWPLSIFLYTMITVYIYYILPSERLKIKDIIPGSIVAALGLVGVTYVYSIYAKTMANYNVLYGSLATVVAILLWFYFLAWVICIGFLVNRGVMDTRKAS